MRLNQRISSSSCLLLGNIELAWRQATSRMMILITQATGMAHQAGSGVSCSPFVAANKWPRHLKETLELCSSAKVKFSQCRRCLWSNLFVVVEVQGATRRRLNICLLCNILMSVVISQLGRNQVIIRGVHLAVKRARRAANWTRRMTIVDVHRAAPSRTATSCAS